MATLEDIQKRRADIREKQDKSRAEQEALDLEAICVLEEARGEPLYTMTANGFKPGVSVKIAFDAPTSAQYKRYSEMVARAGKENPVARVKAQEMLAAVCLVYPPEGKARDALLEAFPGVLISLAIEAAKVAELRAEEEGKG